MAVSNGVKPVRDTCPKCGQMGIQIIHSLNDGRYKSLAYRHKMVAKSSRKRATGSSNQQSNPKLKESWCTIGTFPSSDDPIEEDKAKKKLVDDVIADITCSLDGDTPDYDRAEVYSIDERKILKDKCQTCGRTGIPVNVPSKNNLHAPLLNNSITLALRHSMICCILELKCCTP